MFLLLTKYLFQYKKVAIPHVGQLQLVTKPATFNYADQQIQPPAYEAAFSAIADADHHQVHYIAQASQTDEATALQQLDTFGAALKNKIQQQVFTWNGIGQLSSAEGAITFHPQIINVPALQSIATAKVLRENVSHNVLIGDQQVQSHEVKELLEPPTVKRNYRMLIIAGAVLFLAIAYVVFSLYQQGFQPAAAGYKSKVNPAATQPTYH